MPELDPYQQALEEVERRRKEYGEIAAAPPQYERPGFWRSLAAIGTGAFGGSQYDKGGMQWGQQMAREITEGPYQRKMNEHLKMLAAKRQGLDVAQEGLGVLGQIEARKQQIEVAKQRAADSKANNEEKLKAEKLKQAQVYDAIINKQTGNASIRYPSLEALQADPDAQAKIKAGTHTLRQPAGTDLVYLAPTTETLRRAAFEEVEPLANQINTMLAANPILKQRGFVPVDVEKASTRGSQALQSILTQMNHTLDLEMQAKTRAARAAGGRGGEDPDTKQRRYEHNKVWENSRRNVASLTKQISALQNRIATTQDENVKAALKENLAELQQNIAETLNSAYQEDPMMKPESMKQYEVKNGALVEVGKQPAPKQTSTKATSKVMTDEIAEKFVRAAGGDTAKAKEMALAEGYTW